MQPPSQGRPVLLYLMKLIGHSIYVYVGNHCTSDVQSPCCTPCAHDREARYHRPNLSMTSCSTKKKCRCGGNTASLRIICALIGSKLMPSFELNTVQSAESFDWMWVFLTAHKSSDHISISFQSMQEKELGSELLNVWLNKPSIDCWHHHTTSPVMFKTLLHHCSIDCCLFQ
jgi:hypothetical protein